MASIVLVTYRLDRGGTDRVAAHLAAGMGEVGQNVTLLCCTSAGALNRDFIESLPANVRCVALSDRAWRSRVMGQVRTFFTWRRWLRQNRADVVLATGNNICWFTGLGLAGMKRPARRFYIKTTNPIMRRRDSALVSRVRKAVYGWLFGRADGVLTLSNAESAILRKQFPRAAGKFQMVHNAYLTRAFERRLPQAATMKNNGRRMHILAAGRLAGQKNFPRLLRAFAAARAANPTVELTLAIAGEGKDKAALVSFADELGVAQHVQWLGHTDNMPELMGQADLFALSSDYEGLPAVVIEALACDCPVIATDCFPAARELLSGLSGCMVTECTDIAFADGLAAAVRAFSAESGYCPSLREHALDYSTRSSVLSHLAAMNLMPSDAKCDA